MASGDLLFIRQGELIVGPKSGFVNSRVQPLNARIFRTRLNFKVKLDGGSNANKAKINIYNLSEASRTFIEQKDMVVFLQVGFESTGLSNLFFGDIDDKNGIHSKRTGPDIITTIEAGDAEKTLREANIHIGFSKGSTNIQAIERAARKLLVSTSFQTDIKKITYQKGFSYAGSANDLLDKMGKQAGFEWSIQNGELLILSPGETDGQESVVISKDTGLIGFPVKTQDKVEFTSLLNPAIRPGRAIKVESQIFLDGSGAIVKTDKADFDGDTHEGKWDVKVEGTII